MSKSLVTGKLAVGSTAALAALLIASVTTSQVPGDRPTLTTHMSQNLINTNSVSFSELFNFGRFLFVDQFNLLDGFGRPGATGNGTPTHRNPAGKPLMLRTSGPDANSCASCHISNQPGGAGEFTANVFVLAQVLDPPTESVSPDFSNERNTLGMEGSGVIDMLAREMTADLLAIRAAAASAAASAGHDVTKSLDTKGVNFGTITAHADGSFVTSGIQGVDTDLIIKPFHQKGVVNSVRVFTTNAYNHHMGMQPVERFGFARTGLDDFDGDGVKDELSVGDITAATIFQAALSIPIQVLPESQSERNRIKRGETLFQQAGCTSCHRPQMTLNNRFYSEPNPYNPPGNLRPSDVPRPYTFDLAYDGRLQKQANGAIVRCYTDLKRHVVCDESDQFFNNEKLVQSGVATDQFITRKLWDVGNTGPWGHRGDCMTIGESIMHHAGEAKASRNLFMSLSASDQAAMIDFLKTLQVRPLNR